LAPGVYRGTFHATKDGAPGHPICYRGQDAAGVVLDGGGETTAVELSGRKHVFLESVTIVNVRNAIAANNGEGIVVRGCAIRPADGGGRGYVGILAQGRSRDYFIADNTIFMNADWEKLGRGKSSYGISLNGTGHVVCHNHIVECWDGISLASNDKSIVTSNIDIHNNFFDRCTDDGVEADYVRHNIRVFRNRILNSGSALSSQPCFGGPTYYLFNEIYNCRIKPYKYHVTPTGIIACHNTSVCSRHGWHGGSWRNVKHRNNLVLGNLHPTVDTVGIKADLDYNGYNRRGDLLLRLGPASFKTLQEAAEKGHEAHGIEVSIDEFVKAALPHHPEWTYKERYGAAYAVGDIDLRLKSAAKAVDAGEVLHNINDGFTGKAPDLGCYELDTPVPHYGPRAEAPAP